MKEIGLKNNYIKIKKDNKILTACGGNQELYKNSELSFVVNQGCGLIAAIDTGLYISEIKEIEFDEYTNEVNSFIEQHALAKPFMQEIKRNNKTLAVGIIPIQICKYLNCHTRYRFKWNGLHGHKMMYEKIKGMLEKNIPVIWALYSPKSKLNLYKYVVTTGDFRKATTVNNHYVTAIGIIEKQTSDNGIRRMIRISSWGKEYFVDYDEYLEFVGENIISKYCSNIVIAK